MKSPRTVAIVRFSAIGDVAMTIPAIYDVCRSWPEVRFIMVTRASMTSMFINRPDNLSVIGIDIKSEYNGWKGMSRLLKMLRAEHSVTEIVDLQDNADTRRLRLLARLHGLHTTRIHKGLKGKRALTRKRNKVMLPLISSRERYRKSFRRAGLPFDDRFEGLYDYGVAAPEAYAAICAPAPKGIHRVGIAPFAKYAGKIYPTALMEEVVASLASHPDIEIYLFGSDDEAERTTLKRWAQSYPGVRSLAGEKHGFDTELALLSTLDCVVSMDSANMHLASLVGVPVVSIWGATHPYCGFKGWRQADDLIIQLPLTCRPCSVFGDRPCRRGDYLCLSAIKPSVISDKVLSLLDKTRPEIGEQ